jgi:hypothetical protein
VPSPLSLLGILWLGACAAAQDEAEASFRTVATSLAHLTASEFLYDRGPEDAQRVLAETPAAGVERMLRHPEPRVRALALVALYWKRGPESLPIVAGLADDLGKAPPVRLPNSVTIFPSGRPSGPAWSEREQTVGEVAREIVRFFMEAAGCFGDVGGRGDLPGFAAYWSERGHRKDCLSWFAVELQRACLGTSPTPPERRTNIRDLRRRIDALGPPYRPWVLLALACPWETGSTEAGGGELASEPDLLEAGAELGDARLMGLLRGEDPFPDDPDMRLGERSPFPYRRVAEFALRNATRLLEPGRAAELLDLEQRHRTGQVGRMGDPFVSSRWATAAADLEPARAREILRAAFIRFREGVFFDDQDRRAILAESLWHHSGLLETGFLKDWFFAEGPQRGAGGFGRHRFVATLGRPETRPLLLAILRDPRLVELDWQTLRHLAGAANAAAGETLFSQDEIRRAWHPLGEGHYHWEQENARRTYPAETANLEAVLTDWRRRLREFARDAR